MRREGKLFPAQFLRASGIVLNLWISDVELSVEMAARLIDSQFPELSPAHVEQYAAGWDNIAYLVNGQFIFRFPHRKMGADPMVNEVRALSLLAPHLPLPVPKPGFVGTPAGD